jgi:hypothetical protein
MATNRERLDNEQILPKKLEKHEEEALEKLSPADLELLISMKKKVKDSLNLDMMIAPPTHHF